VGTLWKAPGTDTGAPIQAWTGGRPRRADRAVTRSATGGSADGAPGAPSRALSLVVSRELP
jgi:hypothetical protein